MAEPVVTPSEPSSLGVRAFQGVRPEKPVSLPLHPTIPQWLERHSLILEGRVSGKGKPFSGKTLPKAPVLSARRFVPCDTPLLLRPPQIPSHWHRLAKFQDKSVPESVVFQYKDYQELLVQSNKDLAIISDLDWLMAGGTSLISQMANMGPNDPLLPDAFVFLQRYMQESSRSLEVLERHSTARFANLTWRLRDSFLGKLHPSVPQTTREELRASSLNTDHIFDEEVVAQASDMLKSDVMLSTNTQSLRFMSKPQWTRPPKSTRGGKRAASTSLAQPPAKQQGPAQQPFRGSNPQRGRGRGSGGNQGKGRGNRGKGRGRGGQ